MNLLAKTNNHERKILEDIGVSIVDKEYTEDELRKIENSIIDFIMNHSTKNNDINKKKEEYNGILNIINKN